jgi:superfamily II DNA or RNA helicase
VKKVLYAHQNATYERIVQDKYLLNSSEMGVGKSLPAVKLICELKKRCVVVCPAFLCDNWKREILSWDIQADVAIFPAISRITLISYDRCYKATKLFQGLEALILDECHYLGNITSRRSKAIHEAVNAYKPTYVVMLTGTPLRNRVTELYSLLMILDYGRPRKFRSTFPSQFVFNMTFCEMFNQRIGSRSITQFRGLKNPELLREWLHPWMIRYKLSDLGDEVPSVIHMERPVDAVIDEDLEFFMGISVDKVLEGGWESLEIPDKPPEHIMSAKLTSAMMKAPSTIEVVKEELQCFTPIVVFSDHVVPVRMIAEGLKGFKVATITGATPMKERDAIVQGFQAGDYDVLIGTIGAMATGITLTKSHVAIFNDLSWVPANNLQAVGRIRRLTQKSKCLAISVVRKGIDTKIARLLNEKAKVITAVVET